MINKHKSNKIKENSNTVRHLNNGTDHRHSKSSCDQSSPARRTIKGIVLELWQWICKRPNDSMPHWLLIAKLPAYGVSKHACNFIISYLCNRRQRTNVMGKCEWVTINRGGPQGYVLGLYHQTFLKMTYFIPILTAWFVTMPTTITLWMKATVLIH